MIRHSATLALNERLAAKRAAGSRVLHLGFGEAGLPVLPEIGQVLAEASGANAYPPVAGTTAARHAGAGYFTRRGLPCEADQLLFAPGSKALLLAALMALPGDLVLPRPSWVSYAAQAELAGKRVIDVPVPPRAGGVPDPALLEQALRAARRDGAEPGILIVTLPDNPTGTLASAEMIKQVCAIAERNGLMLISDEIYRDLTHPPHQVHSPALELPERTIVTSGLSKSLALGGYRIGFARLPDGAGARALHADLVGVASETWSSMPGPMQAVAAYVLDDPPQVRARIRASTLLHESVARAAHREFTAAGATCREPHGGFYLYPDLEPLRHKGFSSSQELCEHLLETAGIGVLPGGAFGDDPGALRFRVATSLLYGADSEQRLTALHTAESGDPTSLPWIADALARLRHGLPAL